VKPDVDKLLEVAAVHLMTQVGPALATSYEQSSTGALGALLLAVREEFERGAQRRVEENRELRRIFGEAVQTVSNSRLRERLEEAAEGEDTSFAISDLERGNAELRELLIDLHVHVEELETPEARRLDEEIWRELAISTERRKLAFAVF
jgi:FKBP-type peptidyl-prolyl cis-trans isomerase (trigger factor)